MKSKLLILLIIVMITLSACGDIHEGCPPGITWCLWGNPLPVYQSPPTP